MLFRRSLAIRADVFNPKMVVPGRVARLAITAPFRTLVIWAVHTSGLDAADLSQLARELTADHAKYSDGKVGVVWVAGDWDFDARADCRFDPPHRAADGEAGGAADPGRGTPRALDDALRLLVGVSVR